jgi:hypothetical protein
VSNCWTVPSRCFNTPREHHQIAAVLSCSSRPRLSLGPQPYCQSSPEHRVQCFRPQPWPCAEKRVKDPTSSNPVEEENHRQSRLGEQRHNTFFGTLQGLPAAKSRSCKKSDVLVICRGLQESRTVRHVLYQIKTCSCTTTLSRTQQDQGLRSEIPM